MSFHIYEHRISIEKAKIKINMNFCSYIDLKRKYRQKYLLSRKSYNGRNKANAADEDELVAPGMLSINPKMTPTMKRPM